MVTLTFRDIAELFRKNNIEPERIEELVVERFTEKKLKLATAESCTGGMISERITRVSGASAVFDCGVCSYANEIKEKVETSKYLVFLDKKGMVYGFNKDSRKYFTIYSSAQGISKNGETSVLIKTANGNINYDLVHDKAKAAN